MPLRQGKLRRIARGSYDANNWLVGATFTLDNGEPKRGSKNKQQAKIVNVYSKSGKDAGPSSEVDLSHDIWCAVERGSECEDISFERAVQTVFASQRECCVNDSRIKYWPGVQSPDREDICKPGNAFAAFVDGIGNGDTVELDMDNLLSQDSFLDMDDNDDDEQTTKQAGPPISDINSALANSCWRSLNSTEPQNGYGILMHLQSTLNAFPNQHLAKSLSRFSVSGLESEGFRVREPYKTELTFRYMERARAKTNHHFCPSSFDDLRSLLQLPVCESMELHYGRISNIKTRSLASALQFSSRSLSFLAKSLSLELENTIGGHSHVEVKDLNDMPIASLFLRNQIRDSLKLVARSAIRCLLQHGHWLYGLLGENLRICKSLDEQQCASETRRCLEALGEIVSYTAWLFCAKEEVPFGHTNCCFPILDVVNSELSNMDLSKMSSNGKRISVKARNEFEKHTKLRFVLSLNTEFAEDLQIPLSNMFGVSDEVNVALL